MRSHAKAATAGSTQRQAKKPPGRASVVVLALLGALLLAAAVASAASAAPPVLWQTEPDAVGNPRGIAVNPDGGHVFVNDQGGWRIVELTAWGEFVKTWGWDVVASGPGDDTTAPEDQFEICVPADGDVCKTGIGGANGAGQFNSAAGLAVDSAGNVYAAETTTPRRVQKFDPEGHFLLSFGGGVNQGGGTPSNPGNVCTAAHIANGDICGAGATGAGPGEFSGSEGASLRTVVAITPDDKVYVGDKDRIQRFDAQGQYQSQVNIAGQVQQLAVDTSGNLYFSLEKGPFDALKDVTKINASGTELATFPANNPRSIAVAADGDVYVFDKDFDKEKEIARIRHFDPSGTEIEAFGEGLARVGVGSLGLAVNNCGTAEDSVYFSNASFQGNPASVRAYSEPPDFSLCGAPSLAAPSIEDQWAASVESELAVVRAAIHPHFWPDVRYYVQYGTAACIEGGDWEAPCVAQKPTPPGALLGSRLPTKTAGVSLAGLTPATEYRYRFVAASSGGGPVFGVGDSEAEAGEDAGFTTAPSPLAPPADSCPNAQLRAESSSAALPDCRAYELVSPVDKEGGDITNASTVTSQEKRAAYIQSAPDGEKIAYSAGAAFGDQPSSLYSNQYIATRQADEGWSSHGINPPQGEHLSTPAEQLGNFFAAGAFSADLCTAWLTNFNEPPLSSDAPAGKENSYRRDNCGAGAGSYEYIGSNGRNGAFEGASADLEHTIVNLPAGIYDRSSGAQHLLSVRPGGAIVDGSIGGSDLGGQVGGGQFFGNIEHAVSADGSRVFWAEGSEASGELGFKGTLYVRTNPDQPESATTDGRATGSGDLNTTTAVAFVNEGSADVPYFLASGSFAVGNPISGPGIAPGTTIAAVTEFNSEEGELTLSAPASGSGFFVEIESPSNTVTNVDTTSGAFAAGQSITAPGIPAGTTITAVDGGAGTLTLSAAASEAKAGAALEASSPCTEAELRACTLEVSNPGADDAIFWTAAADGSRALFTEGNPKTGTATLYEFDLEAAEEEEVAQTEIAGEVFGVLGASDDLSRFYFVSEEVLPGVGPNGEGDEAQAGQPNLYLSEGGAFTFVATLAEADVGVGLDNAAKRVNNLAAVRPQSRALRVTPDGAHLLFESVAPLTHYDNTDAESGKADMEVFRYEAGEGLECLSCNPSGQRPSGRELREQFQVPNAINVKHGVWGAAWVPGAENPLHASNVLSQNGDRAFFNSFESLARGDTNGVQDVYQWQAPGEGSCTEKSATYQAANGGCVDLISSGESPSQSEFWDASVNGSDLFFVTGESLLPQDPGLIDLYDARAGGGFAQPPVPPACEGEACQFAPPPANEPTPASAAFRGAGDPPTSASRKQRRCAKGKRRVRRNGKVRCLKRHQRRANHDRRAQR